MIKNINQHTKEINRRIKILVAVSFSLLMLILGNVFIIQLIEGDKHNKKSVKNREREEYVIAERGSIFDRNGIPLVINKLVYKPFVLKKDLYDNYEKGLKIDDVINLFLNDLKKLNIKVKENSFNIIKESPSHLKVDIFLDNYDKVELRDYSGVVFLPSQKREYVFGEILFYPVGYASSVTKEDLKEYKDIDLRHNNIIGKTGLEKHFNRVLHGENGIKKHIIRASGKIENTGWIKKPINGKDVYLSIDIDLQKYVYDVLGENRGAIVVSDVKTGEILSYVSKPSLNPNSFVGGMSIKSYQEILDDPQKPLIDRVANGLYPPASTIKQYIAYAALMGDYIEGDEIMKTSGVYTINGKRFRDWVRWGHGEVDLKRSLSRSVDYYYYKLGHQMGINYIHDVLSLFGFGEEVNIDGISNKRGILPSDKWKMENYGEKFYAGETVVISIGQGQILSTPLQMLSALSILINDGEKVKFKITRDETRVIDKNINLIKEHTLLIKEGLYDTVNTKDGTARSLRGHTDVVSAGKTGTAQVFSTKGSVDYENKEIEEELRDHALFVGYAPYDDPKIAISIVVENAGGGGTVAAPMAGKIIDFYLGDKKNED